MFYDIFCALCAQNGLSPSGAAAKIGFNRASVTVWKNTGKAPKQDLLLKIAAYFGVTTDYLLTGALAEPKTGPEEAHKSEDALKAAFFGGYSDDLPPEEIDALWEDAREYALFKAEQRRRARGGSKDGTT